LDLFGPYPSDHEFCGMSSHNSSELPSWGHLPPVQNQSSYGLDTPALPTIEGSLLARGEGRSYGDSCLNENGTLLLTKKLNHFLAFDTGNGILKAEAGVTLGEILTVFVPKGWFLPVTPGTKFVSLGGAVANDVHGKNHHKLGNFGNHVISFELLRSDGKSYLCSPSSNAELYHATIGGLGLTGLISWVELKLIPIKSAYIDQEQIKFSTLSEFMKIAKESEETFDYTVAWVDCVNGAGLRGIFIRGNHAPEGGLHPHSPPKLTIPFNFPNWVLNRFTISMFNHLYYYKNLKKITKSRVHYEPFFYPLDSVHHWNRIYGQRGFYQYQFVVPLGEDGENVLLDIINKIKLSGMASFLAVLKIFGNLPANGMMSFPQKGVTLALDFANEGAPLLQLLNECDILLQTVKGRVYPAKDARMTSDFFGNSYNKNQFKPYIDVKFTSSFSRRLHL